MSYWTDRIVTVKAQIAELDAAISALSDGVQSYTLDTGASRVVKTRVDISSMSRTRDSLLNELSVLEVRVYGSGSFFGRPAC